MISEGLFAVVIAGLEETILILYPEFDNPVGIVAEIFPAVCDVSVPMVVGLAKLPDELLSCAVKTGFNRNIYSASFA